MNERQDVLIIGGGVIGVCAAYYLSERGGRVTLIEKGEIAAGSSGGNAGLIVPSHSVPLAEPGALANAVRWMFDPDSPFYIRPRFDPGLVSWLVRFGAACRETPMRRAIPVLRELGMASRALFDELAALDGRDWGYTAKGLLRVYKTAHGLDEGTAEARLLEGYGITAQVLDAAEVRQREPGLRQGVAGAVYYPADAHLDPARFVRGLAERAQKKGACLRTGTEALELEVSGRRVTTVRTTRGEFRPDQVVLAAGAWSPALAADLRLKLPIQAAKGYSVTFRRPRSGPTYPLLLGEAWVAVTPLGDTLRLAGTLEMAGLDLSINQRRVRAIVRRARSYVAGLEDAELVEIWRGLRPCTPDGLPVVGRLEAFDNVVVAAGHAMVGMSLGPVTGLLVAQLIGGERPQFDLRRLRAERFR